MKYFYCVEREFFTDWKVWCRDSSSTHSVFQGLTLNVRMKRFCSINQGEEPAIAPVRVQGAELRNKRSHHSCDLCDKVIIGDLEWTGEAVGTASHKDTRHSFPLLISLSECISRNLLALFVCQGFWSQSTQSGRFRCPALSIISNINTHFLNGGRVSFLDSGTANMVIIRAFQGLKKRHSALESGNQLGTSFNFSDS